MEFPCLQTPQIPIQVSLHEGFRKHLSKNFCSLQNIENIDFFYAADFEEKTNVCLGKKPKHMKRH